MNYVRKAKRKLPSLRKVPAQQWDGVPRSHGTGQADSPISFISSIQISRILWAKSCLMLRSGVASLLRQAGTHKSGVHAAAITTSAASRSLSWFADVPTAPKVRLTIFDFVL